MSTSTQCQGGDGDGNDGKKPEKASPNKRHGATPESDKRYREKKKQQLLALQDGLRRANESIDTLQADLQAERNRAAEERNRAAEERDRAAEEHNRAEEERNRAEEERNRAAALEARIRELEAENEQLRNRQVSLFFELI